MQDDLILCEEGASNGGVRVCVFRRVSRIHVVCVQGSGDGDCRPWWTVLPLFEGLYRDLICPILSLLWSCVANSSKESCVWSFGASSADLEIGLLFCLTTPPACLGFLPCVLYPAKLLSMFIYEIMRVTFSLFFGWSPRPAELFVQKRKKPWISKKKFCCNHYSFSVTLL